MSQAVLSELRSRGGLSAVLQPIYELKRQGAGLLAVECLARGPRGSGLEKPSELFAYAAIQGALEEVDRGCLEAALESAGPLPGSPPIALNVRVSTLCSHDFPRFFESLLWGHQIHASRLILDLGGLGGDHGFPGLAARVRELRALGARIAFDDTGLGEIDLGTLLEIRPDYLKLDTRLVHGVAHDASRDAILRAFVSLGARLGIRVAAEGVEDMEDLRFVSRIGIEVVQGYHFSQPVRAAAWKRGELARHDNYWDARAGH